MTEEVKKKSVNMEDMAAYAKILHNKGVGNNATCSTAGSTAAKEVTMGTTFDLVAEATILVKFANAITVANATLKVATPTVQMADAVAKPIFYCGAALGANLVKAGMTVIMRYDGTNWNIIGDLTKSGFIITADETTGTDIFTAVGSAEITPNDTTGVDAFTF